MADLVRIYDDQFSIVLLTLAGTTAILEPTQITGGEGNGFRVVNAYHSLSFSGKTGNEGDIHWGISVGMTIEEIKSVMESSVDTPSVARNLMRKNQYLKCFGTIGFPLAAGSMSSLFGGIAKEKINWSVLKGQALKYWFYNASGNALTTGTKITGITFHEGVFLND